MIPRRLPTTPRNLPGPAARSGRAVGLPSVTFQVDGRASHAWFARPEPGRQVARLRGAALVPALRDAEAALARQAKPVARRPVRIPTDALVPIRSRLLAPPERPHLLEPPRPADTANDNGAPPAEATTARRRSLAREIIFLAIFAATLAGTFYIGRVHGFHNVIVVPEPWSRHSVLT